MASKYDKYYEEWRELYEVQRKSLKKIGSIYGTSRSTVTRVLLEGGTSIRDASECRYDKYYEEWRELYEVQRKRLGEIAALYGVQDSTVKKYLIAGGVKMRRAKWTKDENVDQEWKRLFLDEGMTLVEIAKLHTVSTGTVTLALRRLGVDTGQRQRGLRT